MQNIQKIQASVQHGLCLFTCKISSVNSKLFGGGENWKVTHVGHSSCSKFKHAFQKMYSAPWKLEALYCSNLIEHLRTNEDCQKINKHYKQK